MPKFKRRIRLGWACYKHFKQKLYDVATSPFTLKVRMLKTGVVETLLYVRVTWTPGQKQLRKAPNTPIFPTDHWLPALRKHRPLMSYAETPQEGEMRERRDDHPQKASPLLFTEAMQWTNNDRLTHLVMLGKMAGGDSPGPGQPEK